MKAFACALAALVTASTVAGTGPALAQTPYPNKPITMVIGWNAGAQADSCCAS